MTQQYLASELSFCRVILQGSGVQTCHSIIPPPGRCLNGYKDRVRTPEHVAALGPWHMTKQPLTCLFRYEDAYAYAYQNVFGPLMPAYDITALDVAYTGTRTRTRTRTCSARWCGWRPTMTAR